MPERQDGMKYTNSTEETLQARSCRTLSRSPHPYHRQRAELPHARLKPSATFPFTRSPLRSTRSSADESSENNQVTYSGRELTTRSSESDSGTEADDEHFLKGLPAPKRHPHKGLRGGDGVLSASPSPLVSPAILNEVVVKGSDYLRKGAVPTSRGRENDVRRAAEKFRRKRTAEIWRRLMEVGLLVMLGIIITSNRDVGPVLRKYRRETKMLIFIVGSLVILYPLRLMLYLARRKPLGQSLSVFIPASFDPAPLLYPPALTMLVASLLSISNHNVLLPNIILSISSLPSELIPSASRSGGANILHWILSSIPLFISEIVSAPMLSGTWNTTPSGSKLDREDLSLLYPLHNALCVTLHYLTTTSLLPAELQLLSSSLINVLILSTSPQAVILQVLLWGGGVGTLIICSHVLKWVVTLARVPRWRFRRVDSLGKHRPASRSKGGHKSTFWQWLRDPLGIGKRRKVVDDSSEDEDLSLVKACRRPSDLAVDVRNIYRLATRNDEEAGTTSALESRDHTLPVINISAAQGMMALKTRQRRHTLPSVDQPTVKSSQRTPSGRRKRSASSSVQSFFSLTETEAAVRKWLYAGYVYVSMLCIILVGIRPYVGSHALAGNEPAGWAMGYLFGNLPKFRMEVIKANLENWICLPDRVVRGDMELCQSGWIEHLRQTTVGPASTRLILCAYWLVIIIVGLAIVFRLSAIYEVDTRRKVFHFMMVAMLLPATYVDPAFAALALSLILAIFLILDLFRASQLPPLSKPLAYFLTPYVDGRDLRGPVVISHIFLLIGCAIPLWLSLAAVPRSGTGCLKGWEVDFRDVSMVSGVICVGMGDAAASLIGRRYGRHKWFWSGGKSIEGSVAFATAVTMALVLAKVWLRIGGWPSDNDDVWFVTLTKVGIAAGMASLTEAVLTGGNDNVVVPVVLWLCVKGLSI